MPESLPERADVRQLRTQAKELLRSLHATEAPALALAAEHDPPLKPELAKLSDAQRLLARKYGFSSWPALTQEVELPKLLEKFRHAIEVGNAATLASLLKSNPALRKHVDDPLFSFDAPAIVQVSHHPKAAELIPVLVRFGADPNARTKWWAGSFGALDHASQEAADLLVALGAKYDVWSAAAKGRIDILAELLDKDPSSVNAPGGDGQRPLHVAKDAETAEFLISRGADLEIRDVDHESTPIQYQVEKKDVVRVLLDHGAKPDIFTAVVLDDVALLKDILAREPDAPLARICQGEFKTSRSNGGHIYQYSIGSYRTPQAAAAQMGSSNVLRELIPLSPPGRLLIVAAALEDRDWVRRIMAEHPDVTKAMAREDAAALPYAAQTGRLGMLSLLLEAGIDPMTEGMDSGTSLHIACWFGRLDSVKFLMDKIPLDTRDRNHGSTPLGWATHGAMWCRAEDGRYPEVVETLLEGGADVHAPANKGGTSMLDQAGNREDVKAVLRRWGAS